MHSRVLLTSLLVLAGMLGCSDDTSSECVQIDERLAEPISRLWCEGVYSPPNWDGRVPDRSTAVCLAPEPDGSCKLCPRDEVVEEVETKMREEAVERGCELEHWEFGCMRTIERGKQLDPTNYCCYQVGQWGSGCKSDTSIDTSRP